MMSSWCCREVVVAWCLVFGRLVCDVSLRDEEWRREVQRGGSGRGSRLTPSTMLTMMHAAAILQPAVRDSHGT